MKWLCFGAGAIGTYIGGSLALAGETVVFVERPAALAELKARGLRLDLGAGREWESRAPLTVPPSALVARASVEAALNDGPFDAAIYALKAYDTEAAVRQLEPMADRVPPIVCFSNGVENEPTLQRVLGEEKVIAATVTTSVRRLATGDIVLERLRGIGIQSTHRLSGRMLRSARAAGLHPKLYSNAKAMKWSKMLTNLIANPTSALLDMPARDVLRDAGIYGLEIRMLRECLAVMRAERIPVVDLPRTPVRALAFAVALPPWASRRVLARAAGSGRGGKMPSFHIDLHAGRAKSEVEYLHGAVVRAGRAAGVATPVNDFLTRTLLSVTRGELAIAEFARQPGRLLRAFAAFEGAN